MTTPFWGKVLRVNLTTGETRVDEYDWKWYRTYLGGWGLIAYTLLKEVAGDVDPLGPDNVLIFAAGLLTGIPMGTSGRNAVGARSPLTGGFGESDVGGFWGAELRKAGWDGIIVEGASDRPVYLWIQDDQVEIRDAGHLWGKTTGDVQRAIQDDLGDRRARVCQIGIAGEKLALHACILNDINHAAGRTGLGAVMGSKRLRAIAVRGTRQVEVVDPEYIKGMTAWTKEKMETDGPTRRRSTIGTAGGMPGLNEAGGLPTRNFSQGYFEGASKIDGACIAETIRVKRDTCYACPIRCKPAVKVDGRYTVDPFYGGPEYETAAAFGSNCCVDDLEAVSMANQLCNAYGLDTISVGATISWAMEAFERGLLTTDDTDGLDLRFGNGDAVVELVEKIARREGFGDFLAQGAYRCAEQLGQGSMEFAVHVRKQEAPMHDPRIKVGLGIGYTVSPTGADHVHNIHDVGFETEAGLRDFYSLGLLEPLRYDDLSPAKVRMVKQIINWGTLRNCVGLCFMLPCSPHVLCEIVTASTGWDISILELQDAAERVYDMAREFNRRCGQTAADDQPPDRFFEPMGNGPIAGDALDRDAFREALRLYYDMMGWDHTTGAPLDWKLHSLGLDWVVDQRNAEAIEG